MKSRTATFINALLVAANLAIVAMPQSIAQIVSSTFEIMPRDDVPSFPVPVVQPTAPGKRIAFDVAPSFGAVDDPNLGVAWLDVCNSPPKLPTPIHCIHMGAFTNKVDIGSVAYNGAPPPDVWIRRGNTYVARFHAGGLEVFGTVKAAHFTN